MSENRLRLLVLAQTAPESVCHGIGLRAHHLLRRLAADWHVQCISADEFMNTAAEMRMCFRPYRYDLGLQQAFDEKVRAGAFDAVLVMGADLLQYAEHCRPPVVADLVDEPVLAALREIRVSGISSRTLRVAKHVAELLPYLRCHCRRVSHCILVSSQDAAWLGRVVGDIPISVVPNGVDLDYFRPAVLAPKPLEIVFSGIMGFAPNVAGAKYFAKEVFPRIRAVLPECRWSIVGGSPTVEVLALAGTHVQVTGFVPDLRPHIEQAAVVVSPLVSGGGMKNKILEAWAMGKAVVATPLGCAGITARDGVDLLIAHNAAEFAAQTVYLLTHPIEARRIGTCARKSVAANYSWDDKAAHLDRILRDAITAAARRA